MSKCYYFWKFFGIDVTPLSKHTLLKKPMPRNTILPYRTDLKQKARKLRKESTFSESPLWQEIRRRKITGYQFHRQVPVLDYIADFFCHELMLAIEVDGASHDNVQAKKYDQHRQSRLEDQDVKFLRFDDLRIKRDINEVLEEIRAWIGARGVFTPSPHSHTKHTYTK